MELGNKEFTIEDNGDIKIVEGHEYIGNRIFIKREEINSVIDFLLNAKSEQNNKGDE